MMATDKDIADIELPDGCGTWTVRALENGQGQLRFAWAAAPFIEFDVGIFGSVSEAVLAAELYRRRTEEVSAPFEQLAVAGFVQTSDLGQAKMSFAKPSGTGRLTMTVFNTDGLNAATGNYMSMAYFPASGVRWSTIAAIRRSEADRPACPGNSSADAMVCLAVADARLTLRGKHSWPLRAGDAPVLQEMTPDSVARPPDHEGIVGLKRR